MFTRTKENTVVLCGSCFLEGLKMEAFDTLFIEKRKRKTGQGGVYKKEKTLQKVLLGLKAKLVAFFR